MTLDEIDLLDARNFVDEFPHRWFTYLREHAPVFKHPEPDGPGFWVVSRYDDIKRVSNDWATFSSSHIHGGSVVLADRPMPEGLPIEAIGSLDLDPPEHTKRRKILNRGFTPRIINGMEQQMRDFAGELLDAAIAKGQADWAEDVAIPLPIRMIATLLGIPREDEGRLLYWTHTIGSAEDPEFFVDEATFNAAIAEMFAYAKELGDRRRAEPGSDSISSLLGGEDGREGFNDTELGMSFMQLAIAGNETTRNTAIQGLQALMADPDQYAALVANPDLIPRAVEEMLRWTTALTYFRRNATVDTEIAGVPIRKGDKVAIYYCSANRDERVFEDPFRFDISRFPNPHVAFGAGGPHFCIGAHLSKLQLRVLFEELVRRVPVAPRQTGPAKRSQTLLLNGVKRLPVDFTTPTD